MDSAVGLALRFVREGSSQEKFRLLILSDAKAKKA